MPKKFFTADTHFGHKRIVPNRNMESIEEMDELLIEAWNSVVGKHDFVYHLGDLSFHKAIKTQEILGRLNGQKVLILGNHDKLDKDTELYFNMVRHYYEIKVCGHPTVMCHFPFYTWNKSHYGSWNLHGHTHGYKKKRPSQMDVGVDTRESWAPYSEEEIYEDLKDDPNNTGDRENHRE